MFATLRVWWWTRKADQAEKKARAIERVCLTVGWNLFTPATQDHARMEAARMRRVERECRARAMLIKAGMR